MAKILVIEDEANLRPLIKYDLKNLSHEVVEAEDGDLGFDLASQEDFDVLIVDWMLPGISGIEIVEKLRMQGNSAIIIMLTAKDQEEDIIEAFNAGVDDYIIKPFSPRELTARITAHLKRLDRKHESKTENNYGNLTINKNRRTIIVNDELVALTRKEYELLEYLLDNKGIVLSRDTILNQIWEFSYDGDTRIVDVHIFKLRNKLINADLEIKANRGIGYILELK